MSETLARVKEVFREVFETDNLDITRGTGADNIEGWDSLMHVTLVVNVEKAFHVKLTSAEVAGFKNVGELVDLIDARTAG